jgi:hypothetical protein
MIILSEALNILFFFQFNLKTNIYVHLMIILLNIRTQHFHIKKEHHVVYEWILNHRSFNNRSNHT